MKCDSCIHKQICKDKPPESYPQFMINIMTDKCENYIHNADVQSVKHGHWVWESNYRDYDGDICSVYSCSVCSVHSDDTTNFCPNCGAKMDGGDTYD